MGKITVVISDEVESQLRDRIRKKGDMGRIIEEALRLLFSNES